MKRAFPTSQRELKSVCHLASLIFWPTQSLTHCSSTHLELMKRTSHPQQRISSQSRLYKGRKGERRRWRVILMNIWQQLFFFPLYPPVDSLPDSYKTYPSLTSVRLSLNWLEISSPLIDLEKQTKSFQHTNFKSELFNFR